MEYRLEKVRRYKTPTGRGCMHCKAEGKTGVSTFVVANRVEIGGRFTVQVHYCVRHFDEASERYGRRGS